MLGNAEISVTASNGIVMLSGQVDTYSKKIAAEKAAQNIAGVKDIARESQLVVVPLTRISDAAIAGAIINGLKWHAAIKEEKIAIQVMQGHVILTGEADWDFERKNATALAENIKGVRSVDNQIKLKSRLTPIDILQRTREAFRRSATIDAGKIIVEVSGKKLFLRGKLRSCFEKEEAIKKAWKAPGINSVDCKIEVELPQHNYVD